MTTNLDARLAGYSSPFLSVFRIIFGLLFTMHGTQKLFDWPVAPPMPIEAGSWPAWWAGLLEFVLGILITLGLFTRIAAFIASGQMAVAYFWMHWPPLEGPPASFWPLVNGGEMAVMYCFAFLLLAGMGAGVWSVDARRRSRVGGVAPNRVVTGTAAPAGYATGTPVRRGGLLSRFRRR
jgi:putative oxidoreductase